jgi:hypothetical protein
MQQITEWLQKLGLGQYAQRFAENDIEIDVLSKASRALDVQHRDKNGEPPRHGRLNKE